MVPSYFHVIEPGKWPLSVNGKKDRKELMKLHQDLLTAGGDADQRVIIGPRSHEEQVVFRDSNMSAPVAKREREHKSMNKIEFLRVVAERLPREVILGKQH